ncbi:helicase domino isoform X2 [Aplysia californica]|uniref:Helicase domino isoform X2 n=1 Tax=Aplysia californica TaxID=6500 RepID=A0ABM1VZH2_APLCA|nr:helicase domino isoform X2 [Aplysia californica]
MQKGDAEDSTKRSPAAGSVSQPQQAVTVTPAVLASGRIQALTGLGGQQTAIGVLPAVSGVNLPTVSFTLPRTISAAQSSAQTLHLPASSLSNSRLVSPQTINIIQRQLSSGVVGLSTVSAQGLQQVLQASGSPLTFVTATSPEAAAAIEEQQRKVRLLQQQRLKQLQHAGSASSSSGGTIHHLAQSGSTNPVSNPNQLNSISLIATNMSGTPHNTLLSAGLKRSLTAPAAVSTGTPSSASANVASMSLISKLVPQQNVTVVTAASGVRGAGSSSAGGPSPKKIKLEEKPAPNKEIENLRKSVISHKRQKMKMVKSRYRGHLTELFYLQGGGNMIEFNTWKKRPSQPLLNFLEGSKLDSDDDDEELQEKRINDEVKVLTSAGSNIPLATPVAISTTLPPSVTALSQQGSSESVASFPSFTNYNTNPNTTLGSHASGIDDFLRQLTAYVKGTEKNVVVGGKHVTVLPSCSSSARPISHLSAMNSSTTTTASLTTTPLTTATTSELQQHLSGKSTDIKPNLHALKSGTAFSQQIPSKGIKSTNVSPGRGRHSISSVYENVTGGSQDVIVERAKQEAQVLQRVTELRKEGLWSAKRLPRVQEPPRQKAHWDYLLEEMTWLAADFIQERKWKKAAAKKLARMVSNHFKEQEQKELRAEKEEGIKLKKIASQMAKMVKEFWTNIEKVVQYKQTTRLEEKKKKALDLHLSFIVDQTEKYSSWLTAGLQNTDGSHTPSLASDAENTVDNGDVEFHPVGTASDDEETIEREEIESGIDEDATKKEVEALQMESELPLEELLKTLPREMLDKPSGELPSFGEEDNVSDSLSSQGKDGDFKADDEVEEDAEETIEEQEKHEKKDYSEELGDLKAEGEMSVEELMKKYAGAYDSDFEMPEESSGEEDSDDEDDEESSESEKESESSEEEAEAPSDTEPKEDGNDEQKMDEKQEDMGLEFLVKKENAQPKGDESSTEGPGKEFNDIAAAAQSLQPKGYTLETTEVKTKVPFLLKHTLREYQHVGLDWLATMHDKRLNGILADEMGLGKTIQTIAMLAHLACDKGVWGPHLIVVPTSVMLNWEMEFKKWCPAFKILTYYGSIKERKLKRQGWTKTNAFHVCITSYKLVVQDHQAFRRKKWKYFILDEAQNIKNFKSQRWQMLLNFSSQRRLLLTGTPLQNSLMELWSLMHFLMPNVFQSHSEFKEWFSNPLTGMIEGSQEYNESLVRRLHKVLRPFLLRRLKNEVEKQMPQKFEHVVMCRLSKRQRYLYDDFMSQTKTKETLATGHFMSVINILMQLRKVCNHPNLFDPRPIVSPFKMEGLVYKTASLATRVLEHDPFNDIDIYSLYPNLAEMESDLPAFVSQRVKQLKATGKLIEEVDDAVDPPPRPPVGQLKNVRGAASAFLQTGKVSPMVVSSASQSRPASPLTSAKTTASSVQSTPTTVNSIKLLLPPPSSSSSGTQQSILIPNPSGSGPPLILPLSGSSITSSSSSPTSAAIASAKLISSQLQSGVLQLVQTSSGHQILTSVSTTSASASTASAVTTTSSTSTSLSLLKLSSVLSQPKPVMRVSPFVVSSSESSTSSAVASQSSSVSTSVMSTTTTSKLSNSSSVKPVPKKPIKRSELFVESVYRRKQERRQHVLSHMAKLNRMRCDASPPLGPDVQHAVNCIGSLDPYDLSSSSLPAGSHPVERSPAQRHCGYVDCLFAQNRCCNHSRPDLFWRETKYLQSLVKSPEEWLHQLQDILSRFVFVTPPVISPAVCMRVSHPCQSSESHKQWLETRLRPEVLTRSALLHPIQCRTSVTFPELRLIQYDCGKLQTLDLLLRQLKSGQHRVLIFTQMTKMLDVLEAFLNFHGHRYLRLDGTTKVEQRQYLMDRFNADPRIFCFILSTRSGGIGVNLTGADTVVFYDSDWNPTMDAQAQDRCHRIGQTRDVHIYRLVSEMTVEENILKKANQKRLLGDLAIEGGNFTTAFFKEQTISDLFAEPSGLESLMEDKEKQQKEKDKFREEKENERMKERERQKAEEKSKAEQAASSKGETEKEETKKDAAMLSQFEQALCKAEDETDAQAAQLVQAEQKAELAEFDENIPWDEREAEMRKDEDEVSKVEMELAMLDKELTPIERYAVTVMEAQMEPETAEELKMAEEDIENSKKDWELARLKALKEEEERKAELEEDEMLYIYSKDDSQMFISDLNGEEMPMWCPPTPPQDDNDIYMEETLSFLYEPRVMQEQSLPPVYVPKALKKPKIETITTRKQKQRKEEQPRVPRSLFDKPKDVVMKQRRDAKMQRLRQNLQQVPAKMIAGRATLGQQQQQATPQQIVPKPEPDPNYPEWLVHEEWALLEAVQHIQKLSPDLLMDNPAQIVNWDFVSDFVSTVGRIFRAAKHCRYQYECVVLPREDGKIVYNIKQKKTPKSIYKTKNVRPLRTEQLYSQEGLKNYSHLYDNRFTSMMEIGSKRPAAMRQTIVNPAAKPTKHAVILAEHGINYDNPMTPSQLATKRAERIAADKKKQQQQQQQQAQQQAQAASANASQDAAAVAQRTGQAGLAAAPGVTPTIQGQPLSSIVSVTPTTVIPGQMSKVGLRTLGAATGNIIVNTSTGLQSGPFAAINKRMSQAAALPSTIAVSANLTPAIRGQRPAVTVTPTITMQDLTAIPGTTTAVTVASQAAAAAAARSALQTTVASSSLAAALQPQLVHATRSLTPHQINILRQNQSIIRTHAAAAAGTQQIRTQKLLSQEQLRAQPLKHPTQKVITQQLLVPVRGGQSILQGAKQGLIRTTIPKMTDEQLQALRMRTQIQTQTGKQIQTAQIIQGQVTPVGQSAASTSQSPVALVKSVSASPAVTVPVNIPVSSISVGQQRTVLASRATTVSQIQQQQRMQLLHQQRKGVGQQKVAGLSAGKANQFPQLLIQQNSVSKQFVHQFLNKNPGTIQQIITHSSQPTIITQVSQAGGQPITQMVAKVSLTSGNQTITPGTPITVTHVSTTSAGGVGLSLTPQGAVKTATITSLDAGSMVGAVAGIQVHSVQPGQKTVPGLTQSLVTAQTVQVQQASSGSGPQATQFLQVTPATVQSQGSSSGQPQQATVTVPAGLVAASALRATPTPPTANPRSVTPTQISLVSAPVPAASIASVQVQPAPAATSEVVATTAQVIAQNVPAPAAMATVVTQTSQPDSSQAGAGQKASPYAMRTRNTKH